MMHPPSLEALADGTRRRIVELLRERPRAVGELAELLPVTQPAVSQHLAVLRDSGLVRAEREGRRRIHHLRLEGLEPLRAWVESFWDVSLDAFRSSYESDGAAARPPIAESHSSRRRGAGREEEQ